jgi:hypothetical protein
MSDRLTVCLVSLLVRASARKRAYAGHETNAETSTERSGGGRCGTSQARTSTDR